jgi:hypothetical protein
MTVEGEGIKTFEAISRTDHSASARAIIVLLEHCGDASLRPVCHVSSVAHLRYPQPLSYDCGGRGNQNV